MRSKISFLIGGAVGYVLGARAGQQRYQEIKTKSQQLWQSEPVQTKVTEATEVVKAKAPVVTEKVSEAAKHAGGAAKTKLRSQDGSEVSSSGTPTSSASTSTGTAGAGSSGTTYTTDSSTS